MAPTPADRPWLLDVAVPMRDNHGYTRLVLGDLATDAAAYDRLWVYDNGSTNRNAVRWLAAVHEEGRYGAGVVGWGPERGIYRMWNDAIHRSLLAWRDHRETPRYLALLNNDLRVPIGFLRDLGRALFESPDDVWITYPHWQAPPPPLARDSGHSAPTGRLIRTSGTRNSGGMSGYAFVLDVSKIDTQGLPLIDEGYLWLCGDGDLVVNVEERGGWAAAVEGVWVDHAEKASAAVHSWTHDQGRLDMRRSRQPGMHNDRYRVLQEMRARGERPLPTG